MFTLATFAEIVIGRDGKEYEIIDLPGRFDDYFVVGFLFAVAIICMVATLVCAAVWDLKLRGKNEIRFLRRFTVALGAFSVLALLSALLYWQHSDCRFELRPVIRQPAAIQTPAEETNNEQESPHAQ